MSKDEDTFRWHDTLLINGEAEVCGRFSMLLAQCQMEALRLELTSNSAPLGTKPSALVISGIVAAAPNPFSWILFLPVKILWEKPDVIVGYFSCLVGAGFPCLRISLSDGGWQTARARAAQPCPSLNNPLRGYSLRPPLYPIYKSFQHVFVPVTNMTLPFLTLFSTSALLEMLEISFYPL